MLSTLEKGDVVTSSSNVVCFNGTVSEEIVIKTVVISVVVDL
jgi:hypothetical protein